MRHAVARAWLAWAAVTMAASGCDAGKSAHAAAHGTPGRAPTFRSQRSKPLFDQAVAGMRALDALRGAPMTEALSTELGFKCADLEALRKSLEPEPDPIVWRLRTDIDRTCRFDVPVAGALLEIHQIQRKRAADTSASVDGECRALKLAIDDLGTAYIGNPKASDILAKDLTYCGASDTVRRIP